jgi:hypothetical protein
MTIQSNQETNKTEPQKRRLWLRLVSDGDRAVVAFLGEPLAREVCFVEGRSVPFDETQRAAGKRPALRFAFDVALPDRGEVLVMEQGRAFYKNLCELRARYPLDQWLFEIERHGAARDSRTTYTIAPRKHLDASERKALAALPRHDLARVVGARRDDGSDATSVDATSARSIAAVLDTLPSEATRRFCAWFGIERVEDLPRGRLESALDRLIALEIEYARTLRGAQVPGGEQS